MILICWKPRQVFSFRTVFNGYRCCDVGYISPNHLEMFEAWYLPLSPSADNIRLAGGNGTYEGRVEVFHDDQWGTVCDDSWDNSDAIVVCQSLGYPSGTGVDEYGGGSGPIWMDEVMCRGSESSLEDCPRNEWGDHDCTHFEDAGVICGKRSRSRSEWLTICERLILLISVNPL